MNIAKRWNCDIENYVTSSTMRTCVLQFHIIEQIFQQTLKYWTRTCCYLDLIFKNIFHIIGDIYVDVLVIMMLILQLATFVVYIVIQKMLCSAFLLYKASKNFRNFTKSSFYEILVSFTVLKKKRNVRMEWVINC